MEQLTQARFQLLNKLRHRGFAHMKRLGSPGETACPPREQLCASHRNDPSLVLFFTDCLDITNNDGQAACLSARSCACKVSLCSPGRFRPITKVLT
jgi:hypothetical protein